MSGRVAVLDFGSQYSHLIVRRFRELGVHAELLSPGVSMDALAGYAAIVLSGGPQNLSESDALRVDKKIFELGKPILGICYGMQLMAYELGGGVSAGEKKEYGRTTISVHENSEFFGGSAREEDTWMSHADQVTRVPNGFTVTAHSKTTPIVAMEDEMRKLYAIQFHPEVHHTVHGTEMLERFVANAGVERTWTMDESWIQTAVDRIKEQVGAGRVLCALSGGVDSAVAAYLVYRAIGSQLTCMYVDTGLMRLNETEEIEQIFSTLPDLAFHRIDASTEFLEKLSGVTNPESKRKIIGEAFIRTFERESKRLGPFAFLAQGTLYTDVISSGVSHGGKAAVIKSHHNVGGLPKDVNFTLVEPLRDLYKDEVRKLGSALGIPASLTERQPFPGPGLAVRIIGEVTKERLEVVRIADAIFREEVLKAGLEKEVQQYFALLPGVLTVGVQGDQRTYGHTVALRAVTTTDFMTADWAQIPHDVLAKVSVRITNEVPGVSRVVYDITSKPPATVEWE